ncbi:PDZ domain-containing protein [Zavarzinella formosa]|uniref:PDZ domain-containing protein n=1 Tax=Zavarzinella formosa TaxID=360055 RepID=UPI0003627BFE|nr:PDZ domain-containing protein [Zavarzinella formosa]
MSFRQLSVRSWLKGLLPGIGLLGIVTAAPLFADPPAERGERPAVRPTGDPTVKLMQTMLEKLRKDLGPNDPAVIQLEQSLKLMTEKKPVDRPAVPVEPPPVVNPAPLRGDGDDFFDLAEELQQQMDVLRNAIQGKGGIQIQGGLGGGPLIIGPGGLQGLQMGGFGGPLALGGDMNVARKGRFGIRIESPSPVLSAQLDLPNGQGIVCTDVPADSVAGKAGIKPHDILLEVAGKPVPSNGAEFINQLREIKADQAVDIVLLRKGRKETLRGVKLPEAVEPPVLQRPQLNVFPQPVQPAIQPPFPVAGPGEQVQVQQQNNAFTVQMSKDGVKMVLTGEKEDGKPVVGSIEIEAAGKVIRAESIDKLPKEYQGMAEKALKNVR